MRFIAADRRRVLIGSLLALAVVLAAQGCNSFVGDKAPSSVGANSNESVTVQPLSTGVYGSGSDAATYELIQVTDAEGYKTYLQWFAPTGPAPGPVIVIADPYDGIDWTGESVDQNWASQPGAAMGLNLPDINGPAYQAGVTKNINYQLVAPQDTAVQGAPLLLNHAGVLIVYGRFYAGGSFKTYYRSIVAGLLFLSQQTSVDPERVGVFGISLGGFEALYGAAHAPAKLAPKFGVAWAPPSDMTQMMDYLNHLNTKITANPTLLEAAHTFFEPYTRRIFSVTGGMLGAPGADYSSLNYSTGVLPTLSTHFLVLHDDWDLMVPSAMNRSFVNAAGSRAEGLWFPHRTPLDFNNAQLNHWQSSEGMTYLTPLTLAYVYLLTRLSNETSIRFWFDDVDAAKSFGYFRTMQLAGVDVSTLVPRLIDMCDSRLTFTRTSNLQSLSGPATVAHILQTYWGANPTTINASTVKAYLEQHGLPN